MFLLAQPFDTIVVDNRYSSQPCNARVLHSLGVALAYTAFRMYTTSLFMQLGVADCQVGFAGVEIFLTHNVQAGAVFLHFFVLATFSWFLVQAESLHGAIVNVFSDKHTSLRITSLLAWLFPLFFVLICALAAWDDYTYEDTCWIDMNSKLAYAVLFPLCSLLVVNLVVCAAIMCTLHSSTKFFTAGVILGVVSLLGLTWIFGLLSYIDDNVAWQYLFASTMLFQTIAWAHSQLIKNHRVVNHLKDSVWVSM